MQFSDKVVAVVAVSGKEADSRERLDMGAAVGMLDNGEGFSHVPEAEIVRDRVASEWEHSYDQETSDDRSRNDTETSLHSCSNGAAEERHGAWAYLVVRRIAPSACYAARGPRPLKLLVSDTFSNWLFVFFCCQSAFALLCHVVCYLRFERIALRCLKFSSQANSVYSADSTAYIAIRPLTSLCTPQP